MPKPSKEKPKVLPKIQYTPVIDTPPGGVPPRPPVTAADIPAFQIGGSINNALASLNQGGAGMNPAMLAMQRAQGTGTPAGGEGTGSPYAPPPPGANPFGWMAGAQQGAYDWLKKTGTQLFGNTPAQPPPPAASPNVSTRAGAGTDMGTGNAPVGAADRRSDELETIRLQQSAQTALDKNRGLYETAKNTGDDAAMAKLDAEWARIAPLAESHGISRARIVNSYMQPGNSAAQPDFARAYAAARADDIWANEVGMAGMWSTDNPAQNDLLWKEHWEAMNKGGRDPLEGHPQAIQNIKAAAEQEARNNQQEIYNNLQTWLTKSNNQ